MKKSVDKGKEKCYNSYIKTGKAPQTEEREKMKLNTKRLLNYWTAKTDPDFIDVPVRLAKRFDGAWNIKLEKLDGENDKFSWAYCAISDKAERRLMKSGRGDVKC